MHKNPNAKRKKAWSNPKTQEEKKTQKTGGNDDGSYRNDAVVEKLWKSSTGGGRYMYPNLCTRPLHALPLYLSLCLYTYCPHGPQLLLPPPSPPGVYPKYPTFGRLSRKAKLQDMLVVE